MSVPDSTRQMFDFYPAYPSTEYLIRKVRRVMDAIITGAEREGQQCET